MADLPRDLPPNPAIPWHLIAREALRGVGITGLSKRFGVSEAQIEDHLRRAVKITGDGTRAIRTTSEINKASMLARSDLVDVLQQAISELVASDRPRLAQLPEFEKLLNSAARLFQWPTVTTARMIASMQPTAGYGTLEANGSPTSAVNLSLIATSPEQLAMMARAQGKFSGEAAPESPQTGDGN